MWQLRRFPGGMLWTHLLIGEINLIINKLIITAQILWQGGLSTQQREMMDAEISTFCNRKEIRAQRESLQHFLGLHSQSLGRLVWQDWGARYHLPIRPVLAFSGQLGGFSQHQAQCLETDVAGCEHVTKWLNTWALILALQFRGCFMWASEFISGSLFPLL